MIGRWFSPGPLDTSTNKTDRHDVTEISLKVALNTINQTKPRDQCAKYGFIRGVTTADVMCYIIRHYRLRYIFNLLSAVMSPHPRRIQIGCIRMHPVAFLQLALNINQSINKSIKTMNLNISTNHSISHKYTFL